MRSRPQDEGQADPAHRAEPPDALLPEPRLRRPRADDHLRPAPEADLWRAEGNWQAGGAGMGRALRRRLALAHDLRRHGSVPLVLQRGVWRRLVGHEIRHARRLCRFELLAHFGKRLAWVLGGTKLMHKQSWSRFWKLGIVRFGTASRLAYPLRPQSQNSGKVRGRIRCGNLGQRSSTGPSFSQSGAEE